MKKIFVTLTSGLIISGCMATTSQDSAQLAQLHESKSCGEIKTEIDELKEIVAAGEGSTTGTSAASIGSGAAGQAVSMGGMPLLGALVSHGGTLANLSSSRRAEQAEKAQKELNVLTDVYIERCSS